MVFRRRFLVIVAAIGLGTCAVSVAALQHTPVPIGSRVEMFVDSWLMDSNSLRGDISLRLQTPQKREIVLVTDKPWEGPDSAYFTVFQDGARVRLYYRGMVPGGDTSAEQVTCYAESEDGTHFTRPNLGLVEFKGSKENNIIYQ